MADKTIGDLTAADTLTGAEPVEVEQGGNSRQTTVDGIGDRLTGRDKEWTAGQRGGVVPVSIAGGQVDWDLADGNVHAVTVNANFQFRLPGDIATHVGQMGVFIFKQNGTGGFTWSVQSGIMPGNSATLFAIAPGANKYTVVSYIVLSATEMVIAGIGGGVLL